MAFEIGTSKSTQNAIPTFKIKYLHRFPKIMSIPWWNGAQNLIKTELYEQSL